MQIQFSKLRMVLVLSLALALLIGACAASAPQTEFSCENPPGVIYFSRHALKVGRDGAGLIDPTGFEQARALSQVLAEQQITHIYVTDILRTQQTAAPLAEQLEVEPVEIPRQQPERQVEALCDHQPDDRVLVVGHRERLPSILDALGYGDSRFEYCRLYRIDFRTGKMDYDYFCTIER